MRLLKRGSKTAALGAIFVVSSCVVCWRPRPGQPGSADPPAESWVGADPGDRPRCCAVAGLARVQGDGPSAARPLSADRIDVCPSGGVVALVALDDHLADVEHDRAGIDPAAREVGQPMQEGLALAGAEAAGDLYRLQGDAVLIRHGDP